MKNLILIIFFLSPLSFAGKAQCKKAVKDFKNASTNYTFSSYKNVVWVQRKEGTKETDKEAVAREEFADKCAQGHFYTGFNGAKPKFSCRPEWSRSKGKVVSRCVEFKEF